MSNECKCVGMLSVGRWATKIEYMRRVYDPEAPSPTLATVTGGGMEIKVVCKKVGDMEKQYRIRKLTPRECWRLMDFDDEDFDKAHAVVSDTQLYRQAGNSIVCNVLVAIFGQMFEGKENVYKERSNK